MTKWKIKKLAKEDWKVLRRKADDSEDGKEYYYISGPEEIYQDDDGNTYKFDTREEALEEVKYLKTEHEYENNNKNASLKKKAKDIVQDKYRTILIDAIDNDLVNLKQIAKALALYMSEEMCENFCRIYEIKDINELE